MNLSQQLEMIRDAVGKHTGLLRKNPQANSQQYVAG